VGIRGHQNVPHSEDEVKAMIASGELRPDDMVWKEGMPDWKVAADVEVFGEAVRNAPQPPPTVAAPENPVIELGRGFWGELRAILVEPEDGLVAAVDKKSLAFYAIWMALGVLVFALLTLEIPSSAMAALLGSDVSHGGFFLRALILALLLYGFFFGVLLVAIGPVLKSDATWVDAFATLGLSSIPAVCVGVVIFALAWLHPFFYALAALAVPAVVIIFYHVFVYTTKVSQKQALYAVPVIYFAAVSLSLLLYGLLSLAFSA
jgi:hypothetical protein